MTATPDTPTDEALRFGSAYPISHGGRDLEVLHFHNPDMPPQAILAVFDPARQTRVTPWFTPPFSSEVEAAIGTLSADAPYPVERATYTSAEVFRQGGGRAQTVRGS